MNPILNQLMSPSKNNNILNMFNLVKSAQNPNEMFQSLMQNNPQFQQVMQVINQNGGDAKQAFYNMAQQKGINPNTILSQLK